MFLKEDTYNMIKYAQALYEQGPAVISDDLNARLKGYLNNATLLESLAKELEKYDDGEYELGYLAQEDFGIMEGDRLFVRVSKEDPKDPKFFMWILNDQFIFGGLDMNLAAQLLKAGGTGTSFAERGLIGSIGSFVSGGGEDSGTDEETIAAISGTFAQIASEKSLDPEVYYKKLGEIFKEKFGMSISKFLDEEFSGYGEAVAMNAFRQDIEPSVWRGLNPWTIIGDVALTLAGAGLISKAFGTGMKGAKLATGSANAAKLAKGGKAATLTKAGQAIANLTKNASKFAKLPMKNKITALSKAGIKKGNTIKWKHGSKGMIDHKVLGIKDGFVHLRATGGSKNIFKISIKSTGEGAELITKTSPDVARKILSFAGLNQVIGAGAVASAASKGETMNTSTSPTNLEKGAEFMGYYDTQKADPSQYIENAKNQGAADIASMLLDLKNGSGLFGNTTNQEEGSMALLITSLIPDMVKRVGEEYKRLDPHMDAYDVLDDELGGDIAVIAKAYWTGCTGEGEHYKAVIANIRKKITKEEN